MKAQTRLRVAYKLLANSVAEHSRLINDLPIIIKEPRIVYTGSGWRINSFVYLMTADEIINLWDAQNRVISQQLKIVDREPREKVWHG